MYFYGPVNNHSLVVSLRITDCQSEGTYLNVHKRSEKLHAKCVLIQEKHALLMFISQHI